MLKNSPQSRQRIYKLHYIDFILDLILGRFFSGKNISILQENLKKYLNIEYAVPLYRGRLGIYLAVKSILSKNKKEIILSPFTIFDVVNMVICAGGIPIFVDVDKDCFTISYEEIIKNTNQSTAGVLITHMHSAVKDVDKISKFCKQKNIKLIEDAAIGFGASYNSKKLGTIGDIGVYSFSMFKFVSSFNGGAVVTNSSELNLSINDELKTFTRPSLLKLLVKFFHGLILDFSTHPIIFKSIVHRIFKFGFIKRIRIINNLTKNDPNPFYLEKIPNNYKHLISNHQAKSINKQLQHVELNLEKRKQKAKLYFEGLKDINEIHVPNTSQNSRDPFVNFPILYKKRDSLLEYLIRCNRDLSFYFYRNCNDLEIFKLYRKNNLNNIKNIVSQVILLPCYPKYSNKEIKKNIYFIRKFFSN